MTRRLTSLLPLAVTLLAVLAMPSLAQARSISWHSGVRIEPTTDGGLGAVSCASSKLCVAGDASGNVLATTNPGGSAGAWTAPHKVDKYGGITGISCPTTTLCVAVDDAGVMVWSSKPSSGAAWSHPGRLDTTTFPGGGYVGFTSISCPSASLCVATDAAPKGNIYWSTDPTGGRKAWHSATVNGELNSVSCPSAKLCVAVGSARFVSTDPSGGAATWKSSAAPAGSVFSAVSCQTVTFCAAVGYGNSGVGFSEGTKTPTAGWGAQATIGSPLPGPGGGLIDTVGCSGGTCVTVDSSDNAWATSGIVNGSWNGGGAIRTSPSHIASAISCKDLVCAVVDSAGVETTGIMK